MKLADWARKQGIDYKTAYRWFREGILPVPSRPLPTGTILVEEESGHSGQVAVYARVSSHDQKADLDRPIARLVSFATEPGLQVGRTVSEVGSGRQWQEAKTHGASSG